MANHSNKNVIILCGVGWDCIGLPAKDLSNEGKDIARAFLNWADRRTADTFREQHNLRRVGFGGKKKNSLQKREFGEEGSGVVCNYGESQCSRRKEKIRVLTKEMKTVERGGGCMRAGEMKMAKLNYFNTKGKKDCSSGGLIGAPQLEMHDAALVDKKYMRVEKQCTAKSKTVWSISKSAQ